MPPQIIVHCRSAAAWMFLRSSLNSAFPRKPQSLLPAAPIPEEAILAKMFLRLRQKFPNLFLIVVPRHFERSRDVGRELSSLGVKYLLRSEVNSKTSYEPGKLHCLLVNTTGELKSFYEHATIVFVGKSLTAKGGQNPIEPCAFGKPTVFGPNMQNFSDIVRAFLAADGAIQVPNAEALESTFTDLLSNEARRNEAGARGLKVVQENLGRPNARSK